MRGRLLLPPAPALLSLLIFGSVHYVAGLEGNDPYSGKGEPFSGDHSADAFEVTSRNEMSPVSEMPLDSELSSGINYDYAEEYDFESQISGYIIDDSVRVEQVMKPKKNKTESENTTDKPKRKKKGGRKGNRKKNPCRSQFKNFCIHGKCVYREDMKTVMCKCHPDYFGERCGEKFMKTQSMVDGDLSRIKLVAITTFVSVVCLTIIAVAVTIYLRKQNFKKYEGEAEEQKKLRQENGNAHAIA